MLGVLPFAKMYYTASCWQDWNIMYLSCTHALSEVRTAMWVKIWYFWVMTPCHFVKT